MYQNHFRSGLKLKVSSRCTSLQLNQSSHVVLFTKSITNRVNINTAHGSIDNFHIHRDETFKHRLPTTVRAPSA